VLDLCAARVEEPVDRRCDEVGALVADGFARARASTG